MKKHKLHIILLISLIVLVSLIFFKLKSDEVRYLNDDVKFGISFSPVYAKALGLEPKITYASILDELNVKNLRLNAYWDEIESKPDNFDFSEVDYYISEAEKRDAKVILTVGFKLPRWPECRAPKWIDQKNITFLRARQLIMVEKTIKYYNENPTISAFQVENEPLLDFGICPPSDKEFLEREISLVRTLTKKPIILTDSGELRSWITPMKLSDILGTTLYRTVDTPIIGTFQYPLQPYFYKTKSDLVRKLFAPSNKKTIIAELQTEAWSNVFLGNVPIETQIKDYPVTKLETTINYARKTSFSDIYVWGVEWWYYLSAHGHPEYFQFAKKIF